MKTICIFLSACSPRRSRTNHECVRKQRCKVEEQPTKAAPDIGKLDLGYARLLACASGWYPVGEVEVPVHLLRRRGAVGWSGWQGRRERAGMIYPLPPHSSPYALDEIVVRKRVHVWPLTVELFLHGESMNGKGQG